jgi:hypothetical protein
MKGIRATLKKLREERPGRRFRRTRKEAEGARRKLGRPVLLILGFGLIAAGLFFMAVPGPGLLILLTGLFLLSLVSRRTARLLDRSEVILRQVALWAQRRWSEAPRGVNVLLVAAGVLLTAALGYVLLRGLEFLQGN